MTSDTRARRRRSRRLPGARTAVVVLAIVLAAAVAAVAAAQVAGRHGEPRPAAAGRPVLPARPAALMAAVAAATASQPAPSATPTPGITLPGAPVPGPAPSPSPSPSTSGTGGSSSSPGIFDIPGQIQQAIDNWFAGLVKAAINPVLALLGRTVLATPDITGQARVTQLWTAMAVLANTLYVLFILAGAVLVTSHETLQTRYSVKEVAPRLVVGMIASNASLAVIGLAISLANALSAAFLGQGVSPGQAGTALGKMVVASIANNSIFLTLMGLGVAVMAVVVLVTYLVRVALMVLITVAAPVALACHALPQTDGLARTWWRALTGCLLIQLGQSLVVIVTVRVFLDPGGTGILGLPTGGGLVDLLVSGTLFYILIKIPFWVRGYILGGGRHGGFAGIVKGLVTYRLARAAMGAFSGGAGSAVAAFGRRPRPGGGARPGPGGRPGGGPGTGGRPRGPGGGRAGRAPAGPAGRGPAGPSAESGARRPVDAAPPLPDGSQARPARHAAPPPLPGGGPGRLARHSKPPPLPADLRPRPPARPTAGTPALPSAQVQPSARHAKPPPLPGGSARHSKPPPLPAAGVQPPRAAAPRGKPVPPAAPPPAGRPSASPGSPARRTPPAVPPPAVPRRPPPQRPRPAAAPRTPPRRS